MRNTSGLRKGPGPGRPKGSKNKATREVKEWFADLFADPAWRESAKRRMIQGKAPHLESHGLSVLMPKTDKTQVSGELRVMWQAQPS